MTHYYSEKQEGKLKLFEIEIAVKGNKYNLFSSDGIFSKKELDIGSRVLIENCILNDNDFVLDIGCGYGAVGITLAKFNNIRVLMTDINERAVFLSNTNIKNHRLKNAEARKSNLYENVSEEFDVILSNPPQSAGKEVCFKIIEGAHTHLKNDGSFQLVARHNKGGETLEKKMKEVFGNVERIGKGSGFKVYMSRKIID